MLLALDIGNTSMTLGVWDEDCLLFNDRLAADPRRTSLDYAVSLREVLSLYGCGTGPYEGAIIASVVPGLTEAMAEAVDKVLGLRPLVVGPGVRNGLRIAIDDPKQLGADMVVGAVGACAAHEGPMVVINMRTATTLSVIDEKGVFLGAVIMPGMTTAFRALSSYTAALPHITPENPGHVIGTNTVHAMQSGAVFGLAAQLDGLVDRIEAELGRPLKTVAATGYPADRVIPCCRRDILIDNDLMMKGLREIYRLNQKRRMKRPSV
ncbi:MAG: type III pantothenate kinase [Lachnospiraceae bacterium]|nr:type III pantothenate kinase [Lachnospiraceae bacterium]